MENRLKKARLANRFTQDKAAEFLKMSVRSYKMYELDEHKWESDKYIYICEKLEKNAVIDEDHGLLTIEDIKMLVAGICEEYEIKYCYLFGSYATHKEKETSDVNLLVSIDIDGISAFDLSDKFKASLNKRIDLYGIKQLEGNQDLLNEILINGIRIYFNKDL